MKRRGIVLSFHVFYFKADRNVKIHSNGKARKLIYAWTFLSTIYKTFEIGAIFKPFNASIKELLNNCICFVKNVDRISTFVRLL